MENVKKAQNVTTLAHIKERVEKLKKEGESIFDDLSKIPKEERGNYEYCFGLLYDENDAENKVFVAGSCSADSRNQLIIELTP